MKVILVALQSIDGFIARDSQDDLSWGSKEDKAFFLDIVKEVDYKIMGSTTFESMKNFPALLGKYSKTIVLTRTPDKFSDYTNRFSQVEFLSMEPAKTIEYLKLQNVEKVAIVGGASIYSQFLQSGLVDEVYLTIAPKLFGQGVKLFEGQIENTLELIEFQKFGNSELLVKYKIL